MIFAYSRITKTWTLAGYFFTTLWLWIVLLFIVSASGDPAWGLILLLAVVPLSVIFMFVDPMVSKRRLKKRDERLAAFASAHGLRHADAREAAQFRDSFGAIDQLHNAREPQIANLLVGEDWEYADFTYNVYGKHKYGEYLQAVVHYGVMSTKLPRRLPNVFFDSKMARGRQFRFHFSKSQQHRLEGDFNKFFVTYFPTGYTIDSMSFISPDVMWVLRDAADYDIEIYGDRLFLYGPLYDPEKQLPDMSAKIARIKKELLDNILTYRDQRLPYDQGRKHVAGAGISLKLSNFWKVVGIVALLGTLLLQIAIGILSKNSN